MTPCPVVLEGNVTRRVNSLENNGCKVSFPPLSAEETAQLFGTPSSEAEKLRIDQEKWEKLCQQRANRGEKNGFPRVICQMPGEPDPIKRAQPERELQRSLEIEKERRSKVEQKRWSEALFLTQLQ